MKVSKAERATGASDLSLESVISLLQRAAESAQAGQSDHARELLDAAGRQVADTRSLSSTLGRDILEFVRIVKRRLQSRDCA
jgi:hypothetical protein